MCPNASIAMQVGLQSTASVGFQAFTRIMGSDAVIHNDTEEVMMKKLLVASAIFLLAGFSFAANAGDFGDLSAKVSAARSSLITLMLHADQRGPEQQKLVKDTADAVSAEIARMKAPIGKEAQFKAMSENWAAFKKTREEELVPLILKGKDAEAKKLAGGIQKERLMKVKDMIAEMDQ